MKELAKLHADANKQSGGKALTEVDVTRTIRLRMMADGYLPDPSKGENRELTREEQLHLERVQDAVSRQFAGSNPSNFKQLDDAITQKMGDTMKDKSGRERPMDTFGPGELSDGYFDTQFGRMDLKQIENEDSDFRKHIDRIQGEIAAENAERVRINQSLKPGERPMSIMPSTLRQVAIRRRYELWKAEQAIDDAARTSKEAARQAAEKEKMTRIGTMRGSPYR